ncbi:GntR family transcriptional regulator [Rariglobus hedericola]|uniref:GntR family transcriptional regulator n=1 Tax=Rariglobus hedericola TaxID=2597822 RepID=A0A556QS89_9BACT|nr:substrate-binding domain-containing protein [Rariglobus hedericola]TSJ79501.1 GntR family transcriptional regulator [Rariglobus hedericola]
MEVIAVEKPRFKHQHLEAEIRQLARSLPVGSRLPAERKLAEQYGCNFLTVRRALKVLVDDGTVVRRVGSGTFVARHTSTKIETRSGLERVGVLVWQGDDAYAYRVLQGVAHEAAGHNVELRSAWVRDFSNDGLTQARLLEADGCAAIILPWFPHDRIDEVRTFVRACALPVSLPMVIPGLEGNSFEQQEIFGNSLQVSSEQLCTYFHMLGHRRIALLGPDLPGDVVLHRMLSAYTCYTSRVNLPNFCGLVGSGAQAMSQLAERWGAFRGDLAVISYDDGHALRFMTAMHKLGLSAPEDFAILGYNDTEASGFSDPPLTTVCQNFNYIGHWLIKSALALARGELAQSVALPRPQMLVRATCGGAGRIDESMRQLLPNLDIVEEGAVKE